MTRRYILLFVILVAAILTLVAVQSGWFVHDPVLTLHIRCSGDTSGRLSLARLTQSGELRREQSVDLTAACQEQKIHLEGYQSTEDVRITLHRGDGRPTSVTAKYGTDIQRDQEGFFLVLRTTGSTPYISVDRI